MYSLFGRHISFSLFMSINFNIIHKCVSIHNTNAYLVLNDSHKYFHIAAIFVLSFMITYVFFDLSQELHSVCIYVCIYMWAHTYRQTLMQFCLHASIHTYVHACLHSSIFRVMYLCLHTCIHNADSCMSPYIHTCTYIYSYTYNHACVPSYMYLDTFRHID